MKTVHIILAFCAGLLLGQWLVKGCKTEEIPAYTIGTSLARIQGVDAVKTQRDSSFAIQNRLLQQQLQVAGTQLLVSRSKLEEQRDRVATLAALLKQRDTSSGASLSDSLVQGIAGLNRVTDSLIHDFEHTSLIQNSLIALRDSQLVICDSAYRQLKHLGEEQALREARLVQDLNKALRQIKRQRFRNKALAFGMLFAAGVGSSLLVKSRQ